MLFPRPRVLKSGTGRDFETWFTPKRFAALLALLIFAIFPDVVLGSHTFYYRDFGCFSYPLAHFHRESFWRGEAPLWNPLSDCGIPMLAQWNTMTLYPLSLFYLLLPMPWALGYFCLGHLFLSGLAMYYLAHHWTQNRLAAGVAGMAFALNGLTLHSLMWPNNIASWAWMPLVILWMERAWREGGRAIFVAALLGATQMLAGGPEIIMLTWGIVAILCLGSVWLQVKNNSERIRWLLRGAAVVALISGLAAAQLLPFFELLKHSHRDVNYANNAWAMPPWGWANLLVPLFHMTPAKVGVFSQISQQWTSSYYLGVGTLALGLLAMCKLRHRRVWLLAGFAILGLLLALGNDGFVYSLFRAVFPGVGFMRFPIKFVMLALLTFPLLAAYAVAFLDQASALPAQNSRKCLLGLWIGLTAGIVLIIGTAYTHQLRGDVWINTALNGLSRALVLGVIIAVVLRLNQTTATPGGFGLRFALVLLLGLDAITHAPRQNPTVITQAYEPIVAKINLTPKLGESRAIVSRNVQNFLDQAGNPDALNYCIGNRRAMFANWNLVDARPKVNGFYSLYLHNQWDIMSLFYQSTNAFPEKLADFLGASQVTSDDILFLWDSRTNALPIATLGQEPIFADGETTLRALAGNQFDPAHTVYLSLDAKASVSAHAVSGGKVQVTSFKNREVELTVETKAPCLVVLAQTDYPCWHATVNGTHAPILRANHAFQAVQVPAGQSQVRLVYEDRKFVLGSVVSILTLLLCLAGWRMCGNNLDTRAGNI